MFRITYDAEAHAVYICLDDSLAECKVKRTIEAIPDVVNIDVDEWDGKDRILGVEILGIG